MKNLFLLIFLVFSFWKTCAQITVYWDSEKSIYGYAIDAENRVERENKALQDYYNKGGSAYYQMLASQDGYGCWAIASGTNENGKKVIGFSYGQPDLSTAKQVAIDKAMFYGALSSNPISINWSGCVDAPQKQQTTQTVNTPQWSGWQPFTATDCNPNIEFQIYKESGQVGFQYQVWLHYQVRNNNDKTVTFQFSCLDAKGKVHFGNSHTLNPGQTAEAVHKMDSDKIVAYRPDNLVFTTTGRPVCEKEDPQAKQREQEQKKAEEAAAAAAATAADLVKRRNELCNELGNLATTLKITSQVNEELCLSGVHLTNDIPALNRDVAALTTEVNNLKARSAEEERKKEEEKRRQEEEKRRAEEQQKRFDGLISQGDTAYNSGNDDNAMAYYVQAKSIAVNDTQKQIADQKYNQAYERKRNLAREDRLKEQNKIDEQEQINYTSAAAASAGAMALLKDQYSHQIFSGKFQLGLGYDQTPLIVNQTNPYAPQASYTDNAFYPTFHLGLNLEFLNRKPINFNIRGIYNLGIHALETGVSGTHTVLGLDGGIRFWRKTQTKFKFFVDFGWYQRQGDKKRDLDAVNNGATATDDVREGKYNYHVLRYGFGPMLHLRNEGKETWIKPGIYFEQITFAKYDKPTMSLSVSANIASELIIEGTYSKNYPIGGQILYPDAFTFENQNYFSLKIIRQGRLW